MNLYNNDEKRDGAPVVPSGASPFKKASAFGKPMFSRTAGGIMERLKNLSRKDMAFVGIGLSVLVMAPVAEYMTSKPSADNLLTPGFGSREGSTATGGVYEPGINALSQGSPDGSGEVITPLSSRDPSSLILGSQPAQPVMPPVTAPPATSFRDSMKDVGRNAFTEAAKATGAPTPIPRMQSALRNFGSFFSGGEGTRTAGGADGKIIGDAKAASSKTAGHGMVAPVGTAGYRGVASNTPNSSSKGAFEKLRSQADKSAGSFNGGSAINSLDKAAADAIDIGKGAGGLGSGQDSDKTTKPSNSTSKYDHSSSGESLAQTLAKNAALEQQKWEFYKKYEIPKQIITAVVGAVSTSIGKFIGNSMDGVLNPSSPAAKCWVPNLPDGKKKDQIVEDNYGNPEGYLNSLCGALGSTQLITSVGDKAATGYQNRCECGRGSKPDYPKGPVTPLGSAQGSPVVSPVAAANASEKEVAEYKRILTTMVTKTAEIQADPTKAATIVPNIAENFGSLQTNLNGPTKRVMSNLVDAAGKSVDDYSNAVKSAQDKQVALSPKYDEFVKQLAAISADAVKGTIAIDSKAQKMEGVDVKAAKNASTNTDKINSAISDWTTSAVPAYKGAVLQLTINVQWLAAYNRQMQTVRTGQESIFSKQANINDAVSKITETDPVKKLKLLTGQEVAAAAAPAVTGAAPTRAALQPKAADTTAASAPGNTSEPLGTAASLYGAALVWASPYEPSSKDVISNESVKWDAWSIGAPKKDADDSTLGPVDTIVTNQMRSNEIKKAAIGRKPDPESLGSTFDRVQSQMETTRNQLVGVCHVSPSYFGGTTAAPRPENTDNNDNATLVQTAAINKREADGVRAQALTQSKLDGTNFSAAGKDYAALSGSKQTLIAPAFGILAADKAKVDSTYEDLKKADTPAKLEEARKAFTDATENYSRSQADYDKSYSAAKKTMNDQQQLALKDYQAIISADHAVTGFKPDAAGDCNKSIATRTATIRGSADNDYDHIMAEDSLSATSFAGIKKQKKAACSWAERCLNTPPAGCP